MRAINGLMHTTILPMDPVVVHAKERTRLQLIPKTLAPSLTAVVYCAHKTVKPHLPYTIKTKLPAPDTIMQTVQGLTRPVAIG